MNRAEIIALQESLNQQGFNLVVDGRYGQKTRDAYAAYLDWDTEVPTVVPPAPKPWYLSRSIIGLLATIAAGLLGRSGYLVDAGGTHECATSYC
jgi:peptidoglycan hydrolase-like protein with peptidoglycan-binding domain